ncbi:immunity 53 family protein [Coraliomargarita akajimensis]|uniref:Rhodanese-related sulfurtransferase n=1 Tax=Coraliomargarita akajimensis (strain DSM 45221 / IAM 15411 / JCM 23193 / KCTC 12865 / 04OKA010-24) TaxID=583355 RepID=D5EQD0_CORAD|nr:immunity 53 family protein [Coraliomargarita akajimensis]ADE53898.1 conserved hypothetical protein [Coraliomargarita akajimensis DSM 45221]
MNIQKLSEWYLKQCDGDWEHSFGVKIDTLDNPGWSVSIDLKETDLESLIFETIDIERDAANWVFCKVEECRFQGACGPQNIDELLAIFIAWSDSC